MIVWVIFIAIVALLLMSYINQKQRIRKENKREELHEKREEFLKRLLEAKKNSSEKDEEGDKSYEL